MQNEKILKYKYRSQRDNKHEPYKTCNVTSLAMALSCVGIEVDEDELYEKANTEDMKKWAITHIGKWTTMFANANRLNQVWGILEKLASDILDSRRGSAEFHENWLTFKDIINKIDKGYPVLVGGLFTHGGHIICIVGYNSLGFICADPWGDWAEGYQSINGENVLYEYDKIRQVLNGDNGNYLALVISS